MGNVAYTNEYRKWWNQSLPLFVAENFKEAEQYKLQYGYSISVLKYEGVVDKYNFNGSCCKLLDKEDVVIAEWTSINNDGDFYEMIKHNNDKLYLIFRQDLYGYSVLDVETKTINQFYPADSLAGGETFIWSGIAYNSKSKMIAVSGCYWACPNGVHLFDFEDVLSESPTFIDLREMYESEANVLESAMITEEEYTTWFSERKKRL